MCLSAGRFWSISKVRELRCFSQRITDVSVLDLFMILIWVSAKELRMWVCWEVFTNWIRMIALELLMFLVLDLFLILIWVGVNELLMCVCWEVFTNWICQNALKLLMFLVLDLFYDLGLSHCKRITDVSMFTNWIYLVVRELLMFQCWWEFLLSWQDEFVECGMLGWCCSQRPPFSLVCVFCDLLCFSFCFWCEIHKKEKNDLWYWRKVVIIHNQDKNRTQKTKSSQNKQETMKLEINHGWLRVDHICSALDVVLFWLFRKTCEDISVSKKKEPNTEQKKMGFRERKQNFVSFHLFFLFCNSFAFSLFTRLPSTTTPPPTLSFLTRFQKKKKPGICSNLNVLFCTHRSPAKKKKQSWEILFPQKKHDTRRTTHGRRRGLPAISWFAVFWECCWDTDSYISFNTWNETICCSCPTFMAASWAS